MPTQKQTVRHCKCLIKLHNQIPKRVPPLTLLGELKMGTGAHAQRCNESPDGWNLIYLAGRMSSGPVIFALYCNPRHDSISVEEANHRLNRGEEHPRKQMETHGSTVLSDTQLIAILLRSGISEPRATAIAEQLLERYGSLSSISRCTAGELARVKGVGSIKAIQLVAAFGLASRLCKESVRREKIDSPERVFQLLGMEMRALCKESLRVVLLDTRYHLMRVEEVSKGTVNESIAHPRDIFQPVFTAAAFAFVLVHNHPSGDPAPSEADRRLTTRLAEASKLLQVQLLDHVIVGSPDNGRTPWFSFKQAGVL